MQVIQQGTSILATLIPLVVSYRNADMKMTYCIAGYSAMNALSMFTKAYIMNSHLNLKPYIEASVNLNLPIKSLRTVGLAVWCFMLLFTAVRKYMRRRIMLPKSNIMFDTWLATPIVTLVIKKYADKKYRGIASHIHQVNLMLVLACFAKRWIYENNLTSRISIINATDNN